MQVRQQHGWAIAPQYIKQIRNCYIYTQGVYPDNSARLPKHGQQHAAGGEHRHCRTLHQSCPKSRTAACSACDSSAENAPACRCACCRCQNRRLHCSEVTPPLTTNATCCTHTPAHAALHGHSQEKQTYRSTSTVSDQALTHHSCKQPGNLLHMNTATHPMVPTPHNFPQVGYQALTAHAKQNWAGEELVVVILCG